MKSIVLLLLSLSAAYAASQSTRSYVPFSWSSCGTSSDPIQIVSMTVSNFSLVLSLMLIKLTPSPIVFGDNITVSATVKVNQEITGTTIFSLSLQQVLAVAVDLTLEKQIIGWIKFAIIPIIIVFDSSYLVSRVLTTLGLALTVMFAPCWQTLLVLLCSLNMTCLVTALLLWVPTLFL